MKPSLDGGGSELPASFWTAFSAKADELLGQVRRGELEVGPFLDRLQFWARENVSVHRT
ncbi:hypothetical protein ACTHPH_04555 [Paenibacillus pasadenensis]